MKYIPPPTERLKFRRLADTDFADLFKIWGDAETMHYFPQPLTLPQMHDWLQRQLNRYEADGLGLWAVLRQSDEAFLGECGLLKQEVAGKPETEVSYHFKRQFWGQGYATEAARACLEFGFGPLRLTRIISMIWPENLPSRRVAESKGLLPEQELFWRGYQHLIYVKTKG